jgi:hypothetical protein
MKLLLGLTKYHDIKTCGSAALPPVPNGQGSWVIPRAGLDAVAKRIIPYPCRESKIGHPVHNPVTILSYPGSLSLIRRQMFTCFNTDFFKSPCFTSPTIKKKDQNY